MFISKRLAALTLGLVPFAFACGGGAKEEAPPPPPAAGGGEAAAPAAPAGGAGTTGTASVSGKVTYAGAVPAPEKIKTSSDAKCQEMHKDGLERQSIAVKDGGLADTLVYVKSGVKGTYPVPTDEVTLNQEGCMYHPTMVALRSGQPLKIRNSDDTLHNIHPRPNLNEEFNVGQPKKGMESDKTFTKQEIMIPVGCDVHPWMRSYISVLDHPFFAVTKDDGTFEIKNLPAGEYEIEAVHGKLKSVSGKITVKDGESAKLDLAYKG